MCVIGVCAVIFTYVMNYTLLALNYSNRSYTFEVKIQVL